jgi:hypothetical protein
MSYGRSTSALYLGSSSLHEKDEQVPPVTACSSAFFIQLPQGTHTYVQKASALHSTAKQPLFILQVQQEPDQGTAIEAQYKSCTHVALCHPWKISNGFTWSEESLPLSAQVCAVCADI